MRRTILAGVCAMIAFAAENDSRIWNGVYTTAQADRGTLRNLAATAITPI
jgi:hypothetical protein